MRFDGCREKQKKVAKRERDGPRDVLVQLRKKAKCAIIIHQHRPIFSIILLSLQVTKACIKWDPVCESVTLCPSN